MKPNQLTLLFDYQFWANAKVLEQADQLTSEEFVAERPLPHESIRSAFVHMLNTDISWSSLFREQDRPDSHADEEFPNVAQIAKKWSEQDDILRSYLAGLDETTANATRSLEPFIHAEVPLWTLIVHLANHGTQHRSEIAATLTELGHSPSDLDMVYFLGDKFANPSS